MNVHLSFHLLITRLLATLLAFVIVGTVLAMPLARAAIEVSTDFAFIGQRGAADKHTNFSNPGTVSRLLFFDNQLILGGSYNHVGTYATNLATFDGSTWGTFGDGTVGGGRAITTHKSKLVVGRYIWDDPGWRYLLGTTHTQINLEHNQGGMPGLVGKSWGLAGAGLALPETYPLPHHVMRWSGFEWIELGTYRVSPYENDHVLAMTEVDGDLVVAGWLHEIEGVPVSSVARWDGTAWFPMGTAIDERIYQFERFQGDLYAASFAGLFRWNGSDWDVVPETAGRWIESLAVHGDWLVVGGSFDAIGTGSSRNVAAWNGASWLSFADLGRRYQHVLALASDGNTLYAGGEFTETEGLPISGITRWTGSTWENLGGPGLGLTEALENTVRAFVPWEDGLVAAGSMPWWGGVPLNGVGLLGADRWSPLGDGFDDEVTSLAVYQGELYAGGYFLQSGATSTPRVARWDGSSWQAVANSIDQQVESILVHDDQLVIGGSFSQIDGVPFDHLARWDGSSWSDVGGGRPASVYALTRFEGDLVAATDEDELRYVERWDGTSWTRMGAGFDERVVALAVHDGRLFAGGRFLSNETTLLNHVAEWTGSTWQIMGDGTNDAVRALVSHGDRLYVAGEFTQAGGQVANRLAAWGTNAGQWEDLGLGLSWYTTALCSRPEGLYVGGDFSQVSTPGGVVESLCIARLELPLAVAVAEVPPARSTAIESIFPNPINPSATIVYRVQRAGLVELAIYDARGRRIRVLEAGPVGAGRHSVRWRGDDHDGRPVSSGVYLVRLRVGESISGQKIVVAR